MDGTLRLATPADAPAVRQLYAPYVEETAITFATAVPPVEAFETKITTTLPRYPWLVSQRDDRIVGYAYAGPLRDRDAYRWTVELSVYVDETVHGAGIGRRLYEALLELLTRQGYASAYGVVTLPNPASVGLHETLGFERVGRFDDVGYKHGEWHDVGWWRLRLPAPVVPEPPRPVTDLDDDRLRDVLGQPDG